MSGSGTFTRAMAGFSVAVLRQRALEALHRARFAVHAVPATDVPGAFAISPEAEPAPAALSHEDVERYVASINNEAELARGMLLVLAAYERVVQENEQLRGSSPRAAGE